MSLREKENGLTKSWKLFEAILKLSAVPLIKGMPKQVFVQDTGRKNKWQLQMNKRFPSNEIQLIKTLVEGV